jgi:hypothetical protein
MAQWLLYFTVAMIVATDIRGNTRKCFQSAFGLKAHLEQRHAFPWFRRQSVSASGV